MIESAFIYRLVTPPRRRGRAAWLVAVGLALATPAWALTVTNVSVVNVTPSEFSLVFQADEPVTPTVAVFSDAAGTISLEGQIGVEPFPAHTGLPALESGYARRSDLRDLRTRTYARRLGHVRVSECRPGTVYYYRLHVVNRTGQEAHWPESGALPQVTTALKTVFVPEAKRLVIEFRGSDSRGEIAVLSSTSSSYPLAAVVGDGVESNQAVFNLPDLLAQSGQTNYIPIGPHDFNLRILSEGFAGAVDTYTLDFSNAFAVAAIESVAHGGQEFLVLEVGSAILRAGESGFVPINATTGIGLRSISFNLNLPTNRLTQLAFTDLAPEIGAAAILEAGANSFRLTFDARAGQSILGTRQLGRLTFLTVAGQRSAFLPLGLASLGASTSAGDPLGELYGSSGRIVVIGDQPLLEADPEPGTALQLFGKPGFAYEIQAATALGQPDLWRPWRRLGLDGFQAAVTGTPPAGSRTFFRALELTGDPPVLDVGPVINGTGSLLLVGEPGRSYQLQYTTNLSSPIVWQPLLDYTLTNSFRRLEAVQLTNDAIFFRIERPSSP